MNTPALHLRAAEIRAIAGAAALAAGLVLLRQAEAAAGIESVVSGAWCGGAAIHGESQTLLGHCARCWPALSLAAVGAGVLFNSLLAYTKALARA
ncbi:MAG: hypothetical protein AB7J28_13380 [Hyphomonadaceae bacterium]